MPASWKLLTTLALALLAAPNVLDAAEAPSLPSTVGATQLLKSRCLSCHGPDKQEGGLRIDSLAALQRGGDRGPAILAESPAESLLVQAVRGDVQDLTMPPGENERLTAEQVAQVVAWIREGARWPEELPPAPPSQRRLGDAWSDAENPVTRLFGGQRLDLWSLKGVSRPQLPEGDSSLADNPIDRFVLAQLQAHGQSFSPLAERRTLIRRLAYDLTGLPPRPEDVEAFVADGDVQAYEKLVDRMLASLPYGERMARHWLDVVRYADTEGFERDEFRPTIYRYRDYVIRAFRKDKPYDLFLREQLAGDELVAGAPLDESAVDRLVATGFLRLGPRDTTAEIFEENDRARDQWLGDLANTTGEALLGLTMSCCQCHDHKYDPLLQVDHFRLRAFFSGLRPEDALPISVETERQEIDAHNQRVEEEARPLRERREAILEKGRVAARAASQESDAAVDEKAALAALDESSRQEWDVLGAQIAEIEKHKRPYTTGWCAVAGTDEPPPVHVLFQGDIRQPRQAAPPGFLSVFDPNPLAPAASEDGSENNRRGLRSALADWIVSPDNPLTARVMVNRIWAQHFGRGLVATPNDFGYSGERPTHPQLLDWLAAEFIASHWSVKHIHRLIVLSRTYRQQSLVRSEAAAVDPENRLLWRQNARRLDAESLRDGLLAVSGRLLPVASGPPRWPAIPDFILRSNPATLDNNGRLQQWYTTAPEEETFVRSIFIVQKRTIPVPFLQPFDLPDSTRSCARRDVTTVAPQASALMNSPFALAMADSLAQRLANECGAEPSAQVRRAFQLALVRDPSPAELAAALELVERHAGSYRAMGSKLPEHDALVDLCRALLNSNEFMYVD